MARKTVDIDGVGPVELVKHRNSRSLKISLQANGGVRVSLPMWAPYITAQQFAQSKRNWILEHRHNPTLLTDAQSIGKAHHLYFVSSHEANKVSARQNGSELRVTYPVAMSRESEAVQSAARKVAIRALRVEAERLLPGRLHELASKHGFKFNSVQIRQLTARWGSCTQKQDITLNLFLLQLPWQLIDYVLVHELCHTKHLHHGPDFWEEFERALPTAKTLRKQIRAHKPAI